MFNRKPLSNVLRFAFLSDDSGYSIDNGWSLEQRSVQEISKADVLAFSAYLGCVGYSKESWSYAREVSAHILQDSVCRTDPAIADHLGQEGDSSFTSMEI